MDRGWYLANSGSYSIDGGLLAQPRSVYKPGGLGCGEPTAAFVREGQSTMLTRRFEHGTVALDVKEGTATIRCGAEVPSLRAPLSSERLAFCWRVSHKRVVPVDPPSTLVVDGGGTMPERAHTRHARHARA